MIRKIAAERGIKGLLHFTRAENLPSILERGLYPIATALKVGIKPAVNDQYRLDGYRNASSLSIGFPNYKMFFKYRAKSVSVDWVILAIDRSVLWTKDCAFCRYNAADGRIVSQILPELQTLDAFLEMFDEIAGQPSRAEQKLQPSDPTDPQAEVLVFDVIEPEYVLGVAFENDETFDRYSEILRGRRAAIRGVSQDLFAPRDSHR